MPQLSRRTLIASVTAALLLPRKAEAASVMLKARPGTVSGPDFPPGVTQLPDQALVYTPSGLIDGRAVPLLVLLHGAGQTGGVMIDDYRAYADKHRVVLLAPTSRQYSWDMIVDRAARANEDIAPRPHFGADIKALDANLTALLTHMNIDLQHIGIMGYSDGATYALTVGLANPALFRHVIALSPGPAFLPSRIDRTQTIFIAHGRNDRTIPFTDTETIARKLRAKAAAITFRPFDGGHETPPAVRDEAMAAFLSTAAP